MRAVLSQHHRTTQAFLTAVCANILCTHLTLRNAIDPLDAIRVAHVYVFSTELLHWVFVWESALWTEPMKCVSAH